MDEEECLKFRVKKQMKQEITFLEEAKHNWLLRSKKRY